MSLGTAFMNFTTGVLEADKKNTQENLVIRGKELDAKRDHILAMKAKKYERDLDNYDKNKEKIDSLNSLKASFANNEIDASAYGKAYIMATKGAAEVKNIMGTFTTQKEIDDYFATIGNADPIKNDAVWKDFKTESVIESNYSNAVEAINNKYSKALKAAKNDSSLVNFILGKKNEEISNLDVDIENDRKDISTIEQSNNTIASTEKKELKKIQSDISQVEATGYTITNEPKKYGVPKKWIEDSKITDLREKIKKDIKNLDKNMVNTTLDVLSTLNVPLPKQFLTYEMGKKDGAITGIKDNGKIVVEDIKLLTDQATNYMTNEWVYSQDTNASNVSNYFSSVEANKLLTSRVRDYSSENTISQQKKGFWSDRENVVGFVPFSVVGLDNDFIYKYNDEGEGSGIIIDDADRKDVGTAYFLALKEIAQAQDPNFEKTNEATAINNLQNKLLKLKPNQKSALLTLVKEKMVTKLQLDKPTDAKPDNLDSSGSGETDSDKVKEEKSKSVVKKDIVLDTIQTIERGPDKPEKVIYLKTNEQPDGAEVVINTLEAAENALVYAKKNNMTEAVEQLEPYVKSLTSARGDINKYIPTDITSSERFEGESDIYKNMEEPPTGPIKKGDEFKKFMKWSSRNVNK
jgi:hypothetical protein